MTRGPSRSPRGKVCGDLTTLTGPGLDSAVRHRLRHVTRQSFDRRPPLGPHSTPHGARDMSQTGLGGSGGLFQTRGPRLQGSCSEHKPIPRDRGRRPPGDSSSPSRRLRSELALLSGRGKQPLGPCAGEGPSPRTGKHPSPSQAAFSAPLRAPAPTERPADHWPVRGLQHPMTGPRRRVTCLGLGEGLVEPGVGLAALRRELPQPAPDTQHIYCDKVRSCIGGIR